MVNLKKEENKIFDVTGLMKLFIISVFIFCPFYFAYHHFVMNDMFLTTNGKVVEKTNHKGDNGKYVYELAIELEDNSKTTITVDADEYIHTEINQVHEVRVFNKQNMNPVMSIVGIIELAVLVVSLLVLAGIAFVS